LHTSYEQDFSTGGKRLKSLVRVWQGVGLCRQMELIPIGGHDGSCRCDTHWCRPCRTCSSGAHLCGGGGLVRHAFLLTSIPRRPTHIHEGNTDQGTAHLRHALTIYRASGSRGSAGRNDPLQLVIITNNPACLCKPDEDGEQNWLIWEAPPTDGHHNQPAPNRQGECGSCYRRGFPDLDVMGA
jgi:hypothetical protein